MRAVFVIAAKDLRQLLRDRRSAIFLVLMPIVFTAFLGLAFRWPSSSDRRPVIGIANADTDKLGAALADMLDSAATVRVERLDSADALRASELVRRGRLDAALVIPAGYTAQLLAGDGVAPEVIADQASRDAAAALAAIRSAAGRVRLSAGIGRLVASLAPAASAEAAAEQALLGWRAPALTLRRESGSGQAQQPRFVPNGFAQSSPGTLVQFAIFGVLTAALLLVLERRSRTLNRMLSAPLGRTQVIAGHVIAMFAVTLAQALLLVAFGQLVLGVHYSAQPLATLVVIAALALWVASLGLFIGTVAKGQEQVSLLSMAAMFGFSAGGGAWFPLELTGRTFSFIGHLLPSAWAMDGLQNICARGLGFSSVLVPAAVLVGWAVAFFVAAVLLFRAD